MDERLKKAFANLNTEAYQDSLNISTDALRFLLTVSISLLTLLLPLLIFVIERTQSRYLLLGVAGALTLCSLASIAGIIIRVLSSYRRKKHSEAWLEYARGRGSIPEKEWRPPHLILGTLAIISGICFGTACLCLFLVLFQILFS